MAFSKYYLILIFYICSVNYFCKSSEASDAKSNLPPEELLRRQKFVDSYLENLAETQKDWIESHHFVYESTSFPLKADEKKSSDSKGKQNENLDVNTHEAVYSPLHSLKTVKEWVNEVSLEEYSDSFRKVYLEPKFSEAKSKVSLEEFERRRENFLSFFSELDDLEKNDEGSDFSCKSKKATVSLDVLDEHKKIKSNAENNPRGQSTTQNASKSKDPNISNRVRTMENFHPNSFKSRIESNKIDSDHSVSNNGAHIEGLNDRIKQPTLEQTVGNEDFCLHEKMYFYLTKTCDLKENSKVMPFNCNTRKLKKQSLERLEGETSIYSSDQISTMHAIKDSPLSESSSIIRDNDVSENGEINTSKDEILFDSELSEIQSLVNSLSVKVRSMLKIKNSSSKSQNPEINKVNSEKGLGGKSDATNNESWLNSELTQIQNLLYAYSKKIRSVNLEKDSSSSESLKTEEVKVHSENIIGSKSELSKEQKQNLVNLYLSKLKKEQQNWIETYQFSYEDDYENQGSYPNQISANSQNLLNQNNLMVSKANYNSEYSLEKQHLIRWVNKLLNKYSDYSFSDQSRLSFSLSDDSHSKLKELSSSKTFDFSVLDELVCGLISNATLHNAYELNSSYFSFSGSTFFCSAVIFLCIYCIYYLIGVMIYNRYLITLLFFITFAMSILFNGYKLYLQKVAEKHALLSRIDSSYCQSVLSYESGVIAHLKEWARHAWHGEDCRKYYEALMAEPLSEISIFIIIADLVSSFFSHLIKPLGGTINIFFKDLVYDLGILDRVYLFVIIGAILLCCLFFLPFCLNYKLNFPFFMGSLEPSTAHAGSRVEDVKLVDKKDSLQNSTIPTLPPVNYTTVIHLADVYKGSYVYKGQDMIESKEKFANSLTPEKYILPKMPRVIIRRSSL